MSSSPVIDSPYLINSAPERVRINFCEGRRDERSDLRNARDRDSFVFRTVAHVHTTLHSQLLAALGRPGIQQQAESGTRVAVQQAPYTIVQTAGTKRVSEPVCRPGQAFVRSVEFTAHHSEAIRG